MRRRISDAIRHALLDRASAISDLEKLRRVSKRKRDHRAEIAALRALRVVASHDAVGTLAICRELAARGRKPDDYLHLAIVEERLGNGLEALIACRRAIASSKDSELTILANAVLSRLENRDPETARLTVAVGSAAFWTELVAIRQSFAGHPLIGQRRLLALHRRLAKRPDLQRIVVRALKEGVGRENSEKRFRVLRDTASLLIRSTVAAPVQRARKRKKR